MAAGRTGKPGRTASPCPPGHYPGGLCRCGAGVKLISTSHAGPVRPSRVTRRWAPLSSSMSATFPTRCGASSSPWPSREWTATGESPPEIPGVDRVDEHTLCLGEVLERLRGLDDENLARTPDVVAGDDNHGQAVRAGERVQGDPPPRRGPVDVGAPRRERPGGRHWRLGEGPGASGDEQPGADAVGGAAEGPGQAAAECEPGNRHAGLEQAEDDADLQPGAGAGAQDPDADRSGEVRQAEGQCDQDQGEHVITLFSGRPGRRQGTYRAWPRLAMARGHRARGPSDGPGRSDAADPSG
jgi:hypothetical protein